MDKPRTGGAAQVRIHAKWASADALRSEMATEINVLRANDHYILTFGEVRLPIIEKEPPATIEGQIRPVVRLIIPAYSLPAILKALNNVAEQHPDK